MYQYSDPLFLVVNAKSARGLSLAAYVLETLSYAITLAYSYRNDYPFSTYGENFFLTIQNVIITLLIIHYPTSRISRQLQSTTPKLALAVALTGLSAATLYMIPSPSLSMLQAATLPLSLFSKMPQIRQNYRARSTGQLSAFAVISQILGCLARLFTTSQEVGDSLVSAGFALALLLNVVLGIQLWAYWGKDDHEAAIPVSATETYEEKEKVQVSTWQENGRVEVVVPPASPATPTGSRAQAGRRWARKVD